MQFISLHYTLLVTPYIINEKATVQLKSVSALEYVDVSKRSLMANIMCAIGQTIAGCSEPWILKALGDWHTFFLINASPVALVFITPLYLLKESTIVHYPKRF